MVCSPQDAPKEVLALAEQLVPQLLVGDHPEMAIIFWILILYWRFIGIEFRAQTLRMWKIVRAAPA